MLSIHVPASLQIEKRGAHPSYFTKESGYVDLVDLSILTEKQLKIAGVNEVDPCCRGIWVQVMDKYEDQPVLIVTSKGSYLIQSDPLRLNNAPLAAVESEILGVYPLYRLVEYKRPFNTRILNKLRWLVCKKKSIFELDHFDD